MVKLLDKMLGNLILKKKKIVLFDIDYTLFNTDLFKSSGLKTHKLYSEVESVLSKLKNEAVLGILSEGKKELQNNKLLSTGITRFFQSHAIHVVEDKLNDLVAVLNKYKDSKIFMVDDRLEALEKAAKHVPSAFTVWIKRGKYAKNQKPIKNFTPNAIIEDLEELVSHVKSS